MSKFLGFSAVVSTIMQLDCYWFGCCSWRACLGHRRSLANCVVFDTISAELMQCCLETLSLAKLLFIFVVELPSEDGEFSSVSVVYVDVGDL